MSIEQCRVKLASPIKFNNVSIEQALRYKSLEEVIVGFHPPYILICVELRYLVHVSSVFLSENL